MYSQAAFENCRHCLGIETNMIHCDIPGVIIPGQGNILLRFVHDKGSTDRVFAFNPIFYINCIYIQDIYVARKNEKNLLPAASGTDLYSLHRHFRERDKIW